MAREAGAHASPALGREHREGPITSARVLGMRDALLNVPKGRGGARARTIRLHLRRGQNTAATTSDNA